MLWGHLPIGGLLGSHCCTPWSLLPWGLSPWSLNLVCVNCRGPSLPPIHAVTQGMGRHALGVYRLYWGDTVSIDMRDWGGTVSTGMPGETGGSIKLLQLGWFSVVPWRLRGIPHMVSGHACRWVTGSMRKEGTLPGNGTFGPWLAGRGIGPLCGMHSPVAMFDALTLAD